MWLFLWDVNFADDYNKVVALYFITTHTLHADFLISWIASHPQKLQNLYFLYYERTRPGEVVIFH